MIDGRRRGERDARCILAVRLGNPGNVLVTTPFGRVLTLPSNGNLEVAP